MQATTGMRVTEECTSSFLEMKWKKVHRYIVFKIDENSRKVTVDKVGGAGENYQDLAASLPVDDCRYAVFDFDFVTVDNCRKSKIFFIYWLVVLINSQNYNIYLYTLPVIITISSPTVCLNGSVRVNTVCTKFCSTEPKR